MIFILAHCLRRSAPPKGGREEEFCLFLGSVCRGFSGMMLGTMFTPISKKRYVGTRATCPNGPHTTIIKHECSGLPSRTPLATPGLTVDWLDCPCGERHFGLRVLGWSPVD